MNPNMKLKIVLAIIAALAAWYFNSAWLLVVPFMVFLYGMNGSRWLRVDKIPHPDDHLGTVYFNREGQHYRNCQGETYQMVERGADNWASDTNWKGGKR